MCRNPDKAELYARIEEHRRRWGISKSDYPINTIELCDSFKSIKLREAPFITPGLRGIATKRASINQSDIILLNSYRTPREKNFDCGHEILHLFEHRNTKTQSFHCFEKALPQQDRFLEWQANEGSAELLVPYRQLLPVLKENVIELGNYLKISFFRQYLAELFNVTEAVIKIRFDSLKYEISQYLSGCSLDDLKILSAEKQKKLKIDTASINDIEDLTMAQYYCHDILVTYDERELLDKLKFGE